MEIFVLLTRHSSMPRLGSNDLKLPEHVLIEGVVNIKLHPVQPRDTLHELFGKLAKQLHLVLLVPARNEVGCERIGKSSLGGVERWTDDLAAVGEALRKKSEIEQRQISQ